MSWMSFSWRRRSSLCRSVMRWISFFIELTASTPTSGSSACCVSFSSWILRSHSIIWRSFSTISARTPRFSSELVSIFVSSFAASASISLSWLTMEFSRLKLSFASVPCSAVFLLMSVLRRVMSVCMWSTLLSRSLISLLVLVSEFSRRVRFCPSTVCSPLRRCSFSARSLFSFVMATRSVWSTTHRRCMSLLSSSLAEISRWRLVMVASSGPVFSSSIPPVSLSNWRLRRSTSLVFLSISSVRRRISSSYFSIVTPFSLSSSSSAVSVSRSLELCAWVLSTSTRILASSFSSCVACCSFSLTSLRIRRVFCTVFCADFSIVVCSERLTSMRSSSSCVSCVVLTVSLSTAIISLSS
mmetsp:Transcript_7924/g.26325  ORF Transcript_7924/g.26325 Transcript_7924/m.26325 type:complete len:356 (-) Transcript_7924:1068-2135(-)